MDYDIRIKQRNISSNVQDFFKKCPSHITNIQTYYPIMDDYSYFQNNFNKNKNSIFNNRNIIDEITCDNCVNENDIEKLLFNKTYKSIIYDNFTKTTNNRDVFFKISSILCPMSYIKNEYSENNNMNMPHVRKYVSKKNNKILDKNNTTYIDSFCSYSFSKLVENDICTGFPLYYGNYLGVAHNFICNMTEEYESYKDEKWFKNNINKKFKIHTVDTLEKKIINTDTMNINEFLNSDMYNEINLQELNKNMDIFEIDADNNSTVELYDLSDEDEKFNDSDSDSTDNINLINILNNNDYTFTPTKFINDDESSDNKNSNEDDKESNGEMEEKNKYPDDVSDSIDDNQESYCDNSDDDNSNDDNEQIKQEFMSSFNDFLEQENENLQNIEMDNLSNLSDASVDSTSMSFDKEIDVYCEIQNMPVNIIISENLDGTLETLIQNDKKLLNKLKKEHNKNKNDIDNEIKNESKNSFYNTVQFKEIEDRWLEYLWQIIFALAIAQKYFKFTHNDLHTSNVMYKKTEQEYLYYNVNGIHYKIRTHGYILKIIDFGRGILKIKDNIYFSDVFSDNAEAGEQYTYPFEKNTSSKHTYPNMSFDLSRLSSSMIDDLFNDYPPEREDGNVLSRENQKETTSDLFNLLYTWITDKYGRLVTIYNDFNLYKVIARRVDSAIPHKQLTKSIFNRFIVSKNKIQKSHKIYKL